MADLILGRTFPQVSTGLIVHLFIFLLCLVYISACFRLALGAIRLPRRAGAGHGRKIQVTNAEKRECGAVFKCLFFLTGTRRAREPVGKLTLAAGRASWHVPHAWGRGRPWPCKLRQLSKPVRKLSTQITQLNAREVQARAHVRYRAWANLRLREQVARGKITVRTTK